MFIKNNSTSIGFFQRLYKKLWRTLGKVTYYKIEIPIHSYFSRDSLDTYVSNFRNTFTEQHCVKRVQIRSFFWSVFSFIRTRKNSVFLGTLHAVFIDVIDLIMKTVLHRFPLKWSYYNVVNSECFCDSYSSSYRFLQTVDLQRHRQRTLQYMGQGIQEWTK